MGWQERLSLNSNLGAMLLPMLWWWAAAERAVSHCITPVGSNVYFSNVYFGNTNNLAGGCSCEHTQRMCLTCALQAQHSIVSNTWLLCLVPDSYTIFSHCSRLCTTQASAPCSCCSVLVNVVLSKSLVQCLSGICTAVVGTRASAMVSQRPWYLTAYGTHLTPPGLDSAIVVTIIFIIIILLLSLLSLIT